MLRDRDWRGLNFALGAEPGRFPITVTHTTDQSSFLAPSVNGAIWFGGASAVSRVETATVKRLDDVIDTCIDGVREPRIYLKLDTQGFDSQVVHGAPLTINEYVAGMQAEIAARPLYDDVPLLPDNARPFLALGLEPAGLFAVSRNPRDMISAIEYDLVTRKSAHPGSPSRTA